MKFHDEKGNTAEVPFNLFKSIAQRSYTRGFISGFIGTTTMIGFMGLGVYAKGKIEDIGRHMVVDSVRDSYREEE